MPRAIEQDPQLGTRDPRVSISISAGLVQVVLFARGATACGGLYPNGMDRRIHTYVCQKPLPTVAPSVSRTIGPHVHSDQVISRL